MVKSLEDIGKRVMAARKDLGLTQTDLATALRMERTAISKIETGLRGIDALELAQLAQVLRRPIGWFLSDPSSSVVSRRDDREGIVRREDVELEALALDVEQLVKLGVLDPPALATPPVDSIAAAEPAALKARALAELADHEPVWDLVRVAERLGLYAFVLPMDRGEAPELDGSYVALQRGGVALISADSDSGRRRFTIAHELGHHVLADAYSTEWVVGTGATEREKIINAFAIHFLMPRAAIGPRWKKFRGDADPRGAAIRLAVEFGMSWSAACAQLHRVGCLTDQLHATLAPQKPTSVDYLERELTIRNDGSPPTVPPRYAAAVLRALNKGKLGRTRAVELLHGTVLEIDLPAEKPVPLEAMAAELEPLPR
ncbi:MAG TPA: XRE family transcriptional regulator [Kofleriaceae bacterium]|jgi:Zn-dependent peptidase ImmA (M78 family)/DNA-binding XRE family transcriptional regulator|nr:XRE family transcriptional regulator [Kofleriaceae bacterium]